DDNTSPTPTFISTTTGDSIAYLFSLILSDCELSSEPDTVIIAVNPQLDIEQHNFPRDFELLTVFPNPFNPTTTIQFHLDKASEVSIDIFNINGKLVEILFSGFKHIGSHKAQWNASNQPSGVYFVKIQSGSKSQSQKIILLK
ncbi:T9SS type A sorting domain-containing protein, partial [candidate division KSB1 bacterium]|nr:T9SS type A sorting domain-containing protein [candidate division KSB1 bacterium]